MTGARELVSVAGMISLLAALAMTVPADEASVLETIDAFFVALERADRAAFEEMIAPETRLRTVRMGEDGAVQTSAQDREAFLGGLGGLEGKIVELYWDPVVSISPIGLAQVWAPYYIEFEGRPVHCGVDAFTLTYMDEQWKVTDLHDTRDPGGCERLGLEEARERMRPESLKPLLQN